MANSPAIYSNVKLEVGLTGSLSAGVYNEINGVTKVGGPNASKADIDVSHMGSTAKEYKSARLADPGTLTFSVQYKPTDTVHAYMVSRSFLSGTDHDVFRLTFGDNTTKWNFSGSFTGFSITNEDPSQGIASAEVSVRLTGAINFASA